MLASRILSASVARWVARRLRTLPLVLLAWCWGCGSRTGLTAEGAYDAGPPPGSFAFDGRFGAGKMVKVDLLFMIDNSSSMSDKQAQLARAVPDLVGRFIDPVCIDPVTGQKVGTPERGICLQGVSDFNPVTDLHVGIITSSLGAHGATGVCDDARDLATNRSDPHNNDKAHLVARGAATFENRGFLNFHPEENAAQSGSELVTSFRSLIEGVGQHGCGYEASLESIYRFLIDPEPYETITVPSLGADAVLSGTDQVLLAQRAAFLRPDSVVAVIAVTDEDDCSVDDAHQGYIPLSIASGVFSGALKHPTAVCRTRPNDPCCFNCSEATPVGCPDKTSDPECAQPFLTDRENPPNLRCFHQKERMGHDFLYPIARYVEGFTRPLVKKRDGTLVANPLYSDLSCKGQEQCVGPRDPSRVFFAGIVGVPWQDLARDPLDLRRGFRTARELREANVWQVILGDPSHVPTPVAPLDLHMVASIDPRPLLPGPSSEALADPIHGHEWDTTSLKETGSDLQYACVFDLDPTRTCQTSQDCDCGPDPPIDRVRNPLCQDLATNAYSDRQVRAKAYPGLRHLEFMKQLGDQAIVASICPANVRDEERSDFGYRPAIDALVHEARRVLQGRCLDTALALDPATLRLPCTLVEVANPVDGVCDCTGAGRAPMAPAPTLAPYGSCQCELTQLAGDAAASCRTAEPADAEPAGWCYVDPGQFQDPSQCLPVSACPQDAKRTVRFVSPESAPRANAKAFLQCPPEPTLPTPASVCP